MTNWPMKWELDTIYDGGSCSEGFARELQTLEADIARLEQQIKLAGAQNEIDSKHAEAAVVQMQSILLRLRETESYVGCLLAQDVKDNKALGLSDRVQLINARYLGVLTRFDELLSRFDDALWQGWLAEGELASLGFNLNERRQLAKQKLPPELEALGGDLAVDGYHAWGDLYNTIVSRARFNITDEQGQQRTLSAGQMANRLSDGDRAVRIAAFEEWEREWGEQAELCAAALNRISGFRLKLYERRGWTSVLQEPLQMNRMSERTLDAMWSAVEGGKTDLEAFLQRKAKLLGIPQLDWHDVEAPLNDAVKTVSYDDAAAFILERFRAFDPALADFSEQAFRKGWIEAEDRPGKRPGGFCTSFPKSKQTRIFMTYSGTPSNLATLAHELGHAYHQYLMDDLPPLAQEYAMNVAETASTFAEMIVADAALQLAADPQERLALLEDKIGRSVAFFMNIHARFLFETAFYERRQSGILSVEEINALMEQAQEQAFSGLLGRKHPLFWASKLHFYLTDVPFYNFPYTFGYLFSSGIYARAAAEGPAFADKYKNLLRDTGRMSVEELALKHLDVRLDEGEFWRDAVALTSADIQTFLELTQG